MTCFRFNVINKRVYNWHVPTHHDQIICQSCSDDENDEHIHVRGENVIAAELGRNKN